MDFLRTFSEISKNQNNIQRWEQEKADEDAQRQAYFAQNPPTEKQKAEAKELGRVIVDTVEFMDEKSENKSEAVETTFDIGTAILSCAGALGSVYMVAKSQVKRVQEGSKSIRALEDRFYQLKNDEHADIIEELKKHDLVHGDSSFPFLKRNVFAPKIANKRRFEALSEKTRKFFGDVMTDDLYKFAKSNKSFLAKLVLAPTVVAFGIGTAGQILGTFTQLKASKIARFQAREKLGDTRNFVEYTDEQKAQAEKLVDDIKVPKTKESGAISDLMSLGKDYQRYQEKSAEMDDIHLADIEESSPQEAVHKQQVINNAIKKINNKAEDYSENMETSAGVLLGSSVLGGLLIGKVTNFIIDKVLKGKKYGFKELITDLDKASEAGKKISKFTMFRKFMKFAMRNKPGLFGAMIGGILTAPIALKLQKDASRAGRFKAKKELEDHPENFLYADKVELSKTGATGTVPKDGILDAVTSIPDSIKTTFEYSKYKKTVLKQKKKMNAALKKVDVTDEQMKKAEALKTRLYKSFDVIDDHSEEYSEKMEAAAETGKNVLQLLPVVGMVAPVVLFFKYPHKVGKWATDALAFAFTKFKPLSKRYAKGLGDNAVEKLTSKVKRHFDYKNTSFASAEINAAIKADDSQLESSMAALEAKLKTKLSTYEVERYMTMVKNYRPTYEQIRGLAGGLDSVKKELSQVKISEVIPESMFDESAQNVEKWRKGLYALSDAFDIETSGLQGMKQDEIVKIIRNIKKIKDTVPAEELLTATEKPAQVLREDPIMHMIAKENNINLSANDILVTKEIRGLFYGTVITGVAGLLTATYAMEAYLSAKTKQAGRIGTMKAIQSLEQENEQVKEKAEAQKS